MDVKIYVNPEYKDALWSTLAIKAINAEIMRKRYRRAQSQRDRL